MDGITFLWPLQGQRESCMPSAYSAFPDQRAIFVKMYSMTALKHAPLALDLLTCSTADGEIKALTFGWP